MRFKWKNTRHLHSTLFLFLVFYPFIGRFWYSAFGKTTDFPWTKRSEISLILDLFYPILNTMHLLKALRKKEFPFKNWSTLFSLFTICCKFLSIILLVSRVWSYANIVFYLGYRLPYQAVIYAKSFVRIGELELANYYISHPIFATKVESVVSANYKCNLLPERFPVSGNFLCS